GLSAGWEELDRALAPRSLGHGRRPPPTIRAHGSAASERTLRLVQPISAPAARVGLPALVRARGARYWHSGRALRGRDHRRARAWCLRRRALADAVSLWRPLSRTPGPRLLFPRRRGSVGRMPPTLARAAPDGSRPPGRGHVGSWVGEAARERSRGAVRVRLFSRQPGDAAEDRDRGG